MTSLVKINLGTPPTAIDGDTNRDANAKSNANVDVLSTQAALTSAAGITAAQALTAAHIGKRINIALAAAGVINLPAASTCTADNVLLLRNIGTTVVSLAITTGSGDTVALSQLNPGETALMDTDGVHAWTVLMRGRTNSDSEIVNGNCTVNGNEAVGGNLSVTGTLKVTGVATIASLNADPTTALGPATKQYADTKYPKSAPSVYQLFLSTQNMAVASIIMGSMVVAVPASASGFGKFDCTFTIFTNNAATATVLPTAVLQIYDTTTSTVFAAGPVISTRIRAGDLYYHSVVTVSVANSSLVPGRTYNIRLFTGLGGDSGVVTQLISGSITGIVL